MELLLPSLVCLLGSHPSAQSPVVSSHLLKGKLAEPLTSTWISSMWQRGAGPKDIWLPFGMAVTGVQGQHSHRVSPFGWWRDICDPHEKAPCYRGDSEPHLTLSEQSCAPRVSCRETGQICILPQGKQTSREPPHQLAAGSHIHQEHITSSHFSFLIYKLQIIMVLGSFGLLEQLHKRMYVKRLAQS